MRDVIDPIYKPLLVVAFVLATGCATDSPFHSELSLDNKGTACVVDGKVQVDFGTCLSSSCDTVEGAVCTTELNGDVVIVTSAATKVSKGNTCTADCGAARVTCELPAGSEAAKTIEYAGKSQAMDAKCNEF